VSKSVETTAKKLPQHSVLQESGRYHLFVMQACPWSHRTVLTRVLKGLEDVISISYVKCTWDAQALWECSAVSDIERDVSFWSISKLSRRNRGAGSNNKKDGSNDAIFRKFKELILDRINGPVKVPVLWDKKNNSVVSNKSVEIMRILNSNFNKFARRPKLNLFPKGNKEKNKDVNEWIHNAVNVGVYRCGCATVQHNYDEAVEELTEALDKAEKFVKKRGFIAGKYLTESDIRLFVTLIRLDEVYRVRFKANTRRISQMPGLLTYVRDIYKVKNVSETCDMNEIKRAYYGARSETAIVPRGEGFIQLLEKKPSKKGGN